MRYTTGQLIKNKRKKGENTKRKEHPNQLNPDGKNEKKRGLKTPEIRLPNKTQGSYELLGISAE